MTGPEHRARQLRLWGDELRALSAIGLRWSEDDPHPYHAERYERVRRVAAELFAAADVRSPAEIERTLFRGGRHHLTSRTGRTI